MKKRKGILFRIVVGAVAVLELMCFFHAPRLSSACESYYMIEVKELFSPDFSEINKLPEKARVDTGKIESPKKNKLPEHLKAELLGIAIGSEKEPIAFIKDLKTGKQKIYRQGKYIQGAKLIEIAGGRVVVEKDGNTVEIFLDNHSRKRTHYEKEPVSDAIVSSGDHIVLDKRKRALLSRTEGI